MGRILGGCSLALIAIATAIAGMISIYTPLLTTCSLGDRDALALSFFDGRVRLFYFHTDVDPVQVVPVFAAFPPGYAPELPVLGTPIAPRIRVQRLPLPEVVPAGDRARIDWMWRRQPYDVRLGDRRAVPDFGGKWRERMSFGVFPIAGRPPPGEFSYFRLPVWIPVALIILLPVRVMIVGPWRERRRRRRNQCILCGYNLRGLTKPRCPECGAPCQIASPGKVATPL